jgi:CRP-like cAMP-binding protein
MPELTPLFRAKPSGALRSPAEAAGIKAGSLRRIKMLAEMDERLLVSLLPYVEVVRVPAFTAVVQKGDHGDALFFILEGEVRARVLIDGKETTLAVLGVGECFGELSLLDHGPRTADVISNRESVVLKLSAAAMSRLFNEAPALAAPFLLGLNRVVAQRMRKLTKRYEDSVHFARAAQ